MANTKDFNLIVAIKSNIDNFMNGMNKAKGGLSDFSKSVIVLNQGLELAGKAVEYGKKAFEVFSTVMSSTEGGADGLEFKLAGLKEGVGNLMRSVSTANFGNLISGFIESYEAAKQLAEKFDELEVFSAFSDWEIAGLKRQSAELKESANDMSKSKEERAKIWDEIVKIEETINLKSQALADKRLALEKENWTSINKVKVDAAMTAYATSLTMADDEIDSMAKIYGAATAYYNHFEKGALEAQEAIAKKRMLEAGFTQQQVDSWMTLQKLERGEKDNLIKLYKFQMEAEEKKYNAQMRYNTAVKKESGSDIQLDKSSLKDVNADVKWMEDLYESVEAVHDHALQTRKAAEEKANQEKIDEEKATNDLIEDENIAMGKRKVARDKKNAEESKEATAKALKEEQELRRRNLEGWVDMSMSVLNSLSSMNNSAKQKELDAAGNNAKQREAIEKKYAQKERRIALGMAVINMALAIGKAASSAPWPKNLPAMIQASVIGTAQIAAIAATKFAKGGVVSGPTFAMVGEYAGARSNPEVIAPLDKLQNMLGLGGNVTFRIDGTQLVGVLSNYNRKVGAYK